MPLKTQPNPPWPISSPRLYADNFSEVNEKNTISRDGVLVSALSWLLVLNSAPRGFSPGSPVFPSQQKSTFPNSNSIGCRKTTFGWGELPGWILIISKFSSNSLDFFVWNLLKSWHFLYWRRREKIFSDFQNFRTRNSSSVFPYLVKLNDNGSYDGLREPIRKLENHYHELKIC